MAAAEETAMAADAECAKLQEDNKKLREENRQTKDENERLKKIIELSDSDSES